LRDDERVARLPALELALGPVLPGVAARMPDEAVRPGLDELRPAALADPLDDLPRRCTDGSDVHPVELRRGQLERRRARDDPAGRDGLERRVLAVAVVLADVDDGQLEDLREVQALEEVRLVRGAVAEVRDGDCARPAEREAGAGGRGDAAADDAVAAKNA